VTAVTSSLDQLEKGGGRVRRATLGADPVAAAERVGKLVATFNTMVEKLASSAPSRRAWRRAERASAVAKLGRRAWRTRSGTRST